MFVKKKIPRCSMAILPSKTWLFPKINKSESWTFL